MASQLGVMVTGIVFCSSGVLLTAAIMVFNLRFMKLRFIKMTSPRVNLALLCGTLLLYGTSLLMALPSTAFSPPTLSTIHQMRYWLLSLGFTGIFASMLVKGWRVNRLFQYPHTHTVPIRDGSLFGVILLLLLIDVGILVTWQIIDPITCTNSSLQIISQDDTDVNPQQTCSSEYYSIWILVLLIYKYILVIISCHIGWQIRHITFPALDDARCLLLGSGVTLTLTGAIAVVTTLFPSQSEAVYSVTSVLLWLGTTAILITVFLPKILVVYRAAGHEPLVCSASKYVQQPSSNDVGTELVKILGENKYLKRKLEEREALLSHFKRRLPMADLESHQTSNYSDTSGVTSSSQPMRSLKYLTICCRRVESKDNQVKSADIITAPPISTERCHTYQCNINSISSDNFQRASPGLVLSHAETGNLPAAVEARSETNNVLLDVAELSSPIPLVDARDAAPYHAKMWQDNEIVLDDIDLICNIADTYDLGDNSDTYSYISNCLYSTNTLSVTGSHKRKRRHSKSVVQASVSMLSNDQLYPESVSSSLKVPTRPQRKHKRAVSVCQTNVYTNANGNPLII